MALLLLRNEADCLVPNMETEPVSSHLPPELNRSPITARAVSSFGPNAVTRALRSIHRLSKDSCRITHTFSLDGRSPHDDRECQPIDNQAISPRSCQSARQRTQKKSVTRGWHETPYVWHASTHPL